MRELTGGELVEVAGGTGCAPDTKGSKKGTSSKKGTTSKKGTSSKKGTDNCGCGGDKYRW